MKDAFPRTYIFTVGGAVGVIAFVVLLGVIAFAVKIYKTELQHQMRKCDSFSSPRDSCLGSLGKR